MGVQFAYICYTIFVHLRRSDRIYPTYYSDTVRVASMDAATFLDYPERYRPSGMVTYGYNAKGKALRLFKENFHFVKIYLLSIEKEKNSVLVYFKEIN